MPLVTRQANQGNLFKEALEPADWLDGDLWSDTTANILKLNVADTATNVGLGVGDPHTWTGQQTFVAPILGTVASGDITACTGFPAGAFLCAFAFTRAADTDTVRTFVPLDGSYGNNRSLTEGDIRITVAIALQCIRATRFVKNNTMNGATLAIFRDDGADVTGTDLSIAASTTGQVDSGALTSNIASGSGLNFEDDVSAPSTGSMNDHLFVQCTEQ